MSRDKLKGFIEQEKEAFEEEGPSAGLWDRIEDELGEEESRSFNWRPWAIAASVAMILGVSLWRMGDGNEDVPAHDLVTERAEEIFNEEMAEVDQYYAVQVGDKMKRLEAYKVDEELMAEMDYLTEEFETLKEEMGQGLDDAKVVEALIENYRLRLSLLEDLLEAVEGQDQLKEIEDETTL